MCSLVFSDFVALLVNSFHGLKLKVARNKSLSHVTAASFNLGHVLIKLRKELSLVSSLKTWHMYQIPIFFFAVQLCMQNHIKIEFSASQRK